MLNKAKIIDLEKEVFARKNTVQIKLESGHKILIGNNEDGSIIRIVESSGKTMLNVGMSETGPVVSVNCGNLELKAVENIVLTAKKIELQADESASFKSKGRLEIDSDKEMDIRTADNVHINGKTIHLN
jgi:hypothetical protein